MCRKDEWEAALTCGRYNGSSQDIADGYIHFSTSRQIVASAAKHRVGQDDLVLIEVEADSMGTALRWEASRGGDLFPHLYAALSPDDVSRSAALKLGPDGRHVFPWGLV
ncbi:MAG: DUF952 domain-containing protein [Alphaproteobacteria bacterium]|nr:DUF952 domain-containing protein [Alphaproteobacteria bacterium]